MMDGLRAAWMVVLTSLVVLPFFTTGTPIAWQTALFPLVVLLTTAGALYSYTFRPYGQYEVMLVTMPQGQVVTKHETLTFTLAAYSMEDACARAGNSAKAIGAQVLSVVEVEESDDELDTGEQA